MSESIDPDEARVQKHRDKLLLQLGHFLDALELTDRNKEYIRNAVLDALDDGYEIGTCDHGDVSVIYPPDVSERPFENSVGNEPGTQGVYEARCMDCPAKLTATLDLTVDRETDDD